MRRVYFDNNASTPVDREVLETMLPYFAENFGNASSIHSPGQQARKAVEHAREQVAALVGARATEITFTSGGTESDNLAIRGILFADERPRGSTALTTGKHVITTQIEHSAVLQTCRALEERGVEVTYLPVNSDGLVNPADVRTALRPETVLITVMHANNELGCVEPIEEIGRIAAEADVYFHVDGVQSAGKIPINVETLGADLLAVSAHKIYGPKGVGALYIRKGTRLKPILFGGKDTRVHRPGTENVAGIVGLGKAAELALNKLQAESERLSALRDRLEKGLLEKIPHARVNGAHAPRTPNTANLSFSFIEGESLVIALDLKGLACSTGAACSSGAIEPSHVLTAIGLPAEQARGSMRFSLGRLNTDDDVDFALKVIPEAVQQLRKLSPQYKESVPAQ
jgi:cysteine desulfurase